MHRTWIRIVLLGFLLVPSKGTAATELIAKKKIKVYSSRSRSSRVLTILRSGESASVSKKNYGRWYKVLVYSGGKRRTGFVTKASTRGSKIRRKASRSRSRRSSEGLYHSEFGLGVNGVVAYTSQDEREFDNGDGSPVVIEKLTGTSVFFGFFGDIPISSRFTLRAGLDFRTNEMTGEFGIEGQDTQTVELTQSFLAFSAILKFYPWATGNYWFGGGLELANGTSVDLKYANSDEVEVGDEDLPFFIFVQIVTGYDLHIAGPVFLIPDVRIGAVINTSPMIFDVEGRMNVAYRF